MLLLCFSLAAKKALNSSWAGSWQGLDWEQVAKTGIWGLRELCLVVLWGRPPPPPHTHTPQQDTTKQTLTEIHCAFTRVLSSVS